MNPLPTLHDVYQAHARIKPLVRNTPLLPMPELAKRSGAAGVYAKLENMQQTGAFKVRGAANKLLSLGAAERQTGVITFSTGNHGRAVAYVAAQLGMRAVVCLSEHVPDYRVDMIRALGAEVVRHGQSQDEAEAHYHNLVKQTGLTPVAPFDDPKIIAGQGTIALEMLAERPDIDTLLVQLSGGGLMGGMALTAKSINPRIQIIGLSLERSPAMLHSVQAGKPVPVPEKDSIADSLLGGIGFTNRYTLPLISTLVDQQLIISEPEIQDGMFHLFDTHRLIAEGAAALGAAALIHRKIDLTGCQVGIVLSGASIDSAQYARMLYHRLAG